MLKSLLSLFTPKPAHPDGAEADTPTAPPTEVAVPGAPALPLAGLITLHEGYPHLAWSAVQAWVDALGADDALRNAAWSAAERAWLLRMRQALGPGFRMGESANALLVSSLEPHVARATLAYMERTLSRVGRLLEGIGQVPPWGKDILLVFDDEESYYRYVSYFYPESGEFAFSSGMFISAGCSHYVTMKSDLRLIEPVIAHEMTHAHLSHLPLPLWLNEGLAVNTEHRLAGAPSPQYSAFSPQELRAKHLAYWGEAEIQEFWSGASFRRTDDGNLLSYDLARLMVGQLGREWEVFKGFVLAAEAGDGGAAAALEWLDVDLGEMACALLERDMTPAWSPRQPKKSILLSGQNSSVKYQDISYSIDVRSLLKQDPKGPRRD